MYHIIVNPSSKSGLGLKTWEKLEPVLIQKKVDYQVIFSEYAEHITEIVCKLTDPAEDNGHINLIVVGGDGTLNEVIQGIKDFSKISVGYIPTGSSNDFARAQKYTRDPIKHLNTILSGESKKKIDIGKLTYLDAVDDKGKPVIITRRFDVSCGIGFDAAVCEEAMHPDGYKSVLNKLKLGKLTYLVIALKHLLTNTGVSLTYMVDDKKPVYLDHFLFIAVMQNKYEGGGFMFCPDADNTDGLLDACVVSVDKKSTILKAIPLAFKGKHVLFKGISCLQCKKIHIQTSGPLWIHTDGEVHRKSKDFCVETLADKLEML